MEQEQVDKTQKEQPISGGEIIIDKITKLFCQQNEAEIKTLCLNILLTFNSKCQHQMKEVNNEILCILLLQSVQSLDRTISESACDSIIRAMKKTKEIKQFLVQNSEFFRKAINALLQKVNLASLQELSLAQSQHSIQQIPNADHIKLAFLDILHQLAQQANAKWNQKETLQLIKVIEIVSGDQQVDDEDTIEGKAHLLIPLLKTKIDSQESDKSDDFCVDCQILQQEMQKYQQQLRIKDDQIKISEEQLRKSSDQIRINEEYMKEKDLQNSQLKDQIILLQQQLQQNLSVKPSQTVCSICQSVGNESSPCRICHKDRCRDCYVKCEKCNLMSCKICVYECSKCKKQTCDQCIRTCKRCYDKSCVECLNYGIRCSKCSKIGCQSCIHSCKVCKVIICSCCQEVCNYCGGSLCEDCTQNGKKDNKIYCKGGCRRRW